MKDERTDHDLLTCIEQKVIQHGAGIRVLNQHFENHLIEHTKELKERLRSYWSVWLLVISACLTTLGTLVVGVIALFK